MAVRLGQGRIGIQASTAKSHISIEVGNLNFHIKIPNENINMKIPIYKMLRSKAL